MTGAKKWGFVLLMLPIELIALAGFWAFESVVYVFWKIPKSAIAAYDECLEEPAREPEHERSGGR